MRLVAVPDCLEQYRLGQIILPLQLGARCNEHLTPWRRALAPVVQVCLCRRRTQSAARPKRRFLQALDPSWGHGTETGCAPAPLARIVPPNGMEPDYFSSQAERHRLSHAFPQTRSSSQPQRSAAAFSSLYFIHNPERRSLSQLPIHDRFELSSSCVVTPRPISQQGVRRAPHLRQQVI